MSIKKYFWSEKFRGLILPFKLINFDVDNNVIPLKKQNNQHFTMENLKNNGLKILKLKLILYSVFLLSLCLNSLYSIFQHGVLRKIEFVIVVSVIAMIVLIPVYTCNYIVTKSTFEKVFNLLQLLDDTLSTYKKYKNRILIVELLNFINIIATLVLPLSVIIYFAIPSSKKFIVEPMLTVCITHYALYNIIIYIVISHRLTIVNSLLIEMINGQIIPDKCQFCNTSEENAIFCENHFVK